MINCLFHWNVLKKKERIPGKDNCMEAIARRQSKEFVNLFIGFKSRVFEQE